MKYYNDLKTKYCDGVAPLVGAWIEIFRKVIERDALIVAPLVGAWIEIHNLHDKSLCIPVAPLVGAWIEIMRRWMLYKKR